MKKESKYSTKESIKVEGKKLTKKDKNRKQQKNTMKRINKMAISAYLLIITLSNLFIGPRHVAHGTFPVMDQNPVPCIGGAES